jgi:hypothetical protein
MAVFGLNGMGAYADEVKAWEPGDPLPTVPGFTATSPTVLPLPQQLAKVAGGMLPWVIVAGLAITVVMLYMKSRREW